MSFVFDRSGLAVVHFEIRHGMHQALIQERIIVRLLSYYSTNFVEFQS